MNYSLSEHRLKNWDEIIELKKSDPNFFTYIDTVYKILNSITPGSSYNLQRIRPENRIKFVKIASLFISEQKETYYSFGTDCTLIIRHEESVEETIRRFEYERNNRKRRSQEMDDKTARDTAAASEWFESGGNRRAV